MNVVLTNAHQFRSIFGLTPRNAFEVFLALYISDRISGHLRFALFSLLLDWLVAYGCNQGLRSLEGANCKYDASYSPFLLLRLVGSELALPSAHKFRRPGILPRKAFDAASESGILYENDATSAPLLVLKELSGQMQHKRLEQLYMYISFEKIHEYGGVRR